MLFDFVFAGQYFDKESSKFNLRAYNKGKYKTTGKCCFIIQVIIECAFEIMMTVVGLFDIYTDIVFATIVNAEGYTYLAGMSIFSLVMIAIPKIYAFVLNIMIMFGCVREEDRKRKYVFRILLYNEFRM